MTFVRWIAALARQKNRAASLGRSETRGRGQQASPTAANIACPARAAVTSSVSTSISSSTASRWRQVAMQVGCQARITTHGRNMTSDVSWKMGAGLSRSNRPLGDFVTHHSSVFSCWRADIASGVLSAPFDFVHVDAHSDLGADLSNGRYYVATELLWKPVEERPGLAEPRVKIGNFLLYSLACRWPSSFTFALHPRYESEIPNELLVYEDDKVVGLQAKKCTVEQWDRLVGRTRFCRPTQNL